MITEQYLFLLHYIKYKFEIYFENAESGIQICNVGQHEYIYNLVMKMEEHIKNNVSLYLNNYFIDSIGQFQQLVKSSTNDIDILSKNVQISVYQGLNKSLSIKKAHTLIKGQNKNIAVEFIALRVLWNKFHTFILTVQKLPIADINQICCVIVDTPDFNAPFHEQWKKDLGSMAVLLVKQPYLDNDMNEIKIIRVVIQNVEIKQKPKYKDDVKQIKKVGNQFYNKGDFVSAFYYYQCALSCCFQYSDSIARSILYNNSAASLFKLNLYDSSLKYCSITLKIDRNYFKSYFWKIQCLLQKKLFSQIPNLLVVLQTKANHEDFLKLNAKYSIYLSNSLGMYNWHSISQIRKLKSEVAICDYANKSIGIQAKNDRLVYYAIDRIMKNQLIIISKPTIFGKKTQDNNQTLSDCVVKCSSFQKLMINSLKQKQNSTQKQVQNSVKKYLIKPKDITANQSDSVGLWSELLKFSHNCQPNCSFAHFQSILVISANTQIEKGQIFSLDFACTISPRNRKQYLLTKFNIYCKCAICQWKNWPDANMMMSIEQLSKITDSLSNINMIKHVYWELIATGDLTNVDPLLQKSHKVMIEQYSWTDLIIALQLLRTGNQKLEKILMEILVSGLKGLLKIPTQIALKVIKNLT